MSELYYGKSMRSVYQNLSEEEKKFVKEVFNNKTLTNFGNNAIIYNKLALKSNDPALDILKEMAFKSCESDIVFFALLEKARHETSLSFMDIYSTGYLSLENAWKKFMIKDEKEIQQDIKNGKPVFASFRTYASGFVRDAITIELIKNKQIDESQMSISLSRRKRINAINNAIQSFICINGKIPTDEQIGEMVNESPKVVRDAKIEIGLGNFSEKGRFEGVHTEKSDFEDISANGFNSKRFWNAIKCFLSEDEYEILHLRFILGKRKKDVSDILNISVGTLSTRIEEVLNKLQKNEALINYLIQMLKGE